MEDEVEKKKPFLDILAGECRTLAERFNLKPDDREMLCKFVTKIAVRSWNNGRGIGWTRAKEEKPEGVPAAVA